MPISSIYDMNINFEYNVFARKIAKSHIILAQKFRENSADFE
jgi:hypothetical protein